MAVDNTVEVTSYEVEVNGVMRAGLEISISVDPVAAVETES